MKTFPLEDDDSVDGLGIADDHETAASVLATVDSMLEPFGLEIALHKREQANGVFFNIARIAK